MSKYDIPKYYIDSAKQLERLIDDAETLAADLTEYMGNRRLTSNEFRMIKDSASLALDALDNLRRLHVKYVHGFMITFAFEGYGEEDKK